MPILDSTTHLVNPWSTTIKMRPDFGVYGEKTQMYVSGIDSFLIIYVLSFFFEQNNSLNMVFIYVLINLLISIQNLNPEKFKMHTTAE